MNFLKYQDMDSYQQALFQDVLASAFEGRYDAGKLSQLGQLIIGDSFNLIPRNDIPDDQTTYLGEILTLARHAEIPAQEVGDLIVQHLGYGQNTRQFRAMREATKLVSGEVKNPYHNVHHACNAMIASMVLGQAEGLSQRERFLNALGLAIHDLGHDQLSNPSDAPDRMERQSLEMAGIIEKQGNVSMSPGCPFLGLLTNRDIKNITIKILSTAFPTGAHRVRDQYIVLRNEVENGLRDRIPESVAAVAIFTRADLAEAMTLAGNCTTSKACYQEFVYAAFVESSQGLTEEEFNAKGKKLTEDLDTPEGRAGFVKFAFPYTLGEAMLALESQLLIAELERGNIPSVWNAPAMYLGSAGAVPAKSALNANQRHH